MAIVHIGLPKTGTTSIQRALVRNQEELQAAGIRYPSFLHTANHVELAAYALGDSDPWANRIRSRTGASESQFRTNLEADMAEAAREGSWIFTSEHISSRVLHETSLSRLHSLFRDFEQVRVLMYVRRQDEVAVASHATWVLDGKPGPFKVDDHLELLKRYDFAWIASLWETTFGSDSVEIRLYPRGSVIDDFARSIGIDSLEGLPRRSNVSLDSKALAFVEQMNGRFSVDSPDLAAAVRKVAGVIQRTSRGTGLRMAIADRNRLMQRYAESNEWIMSRAANAGELPRYFDPPDDVDSSSGTMDDELSMEDLLEYAGLAWELAVRSTVDRGDQSQPSLGPR